MSNAQSLANQFGWTITTKDSLNNLNGEIRYVENKYGDMVDMLAQGGYFSEMLNQIKQMHDDFSNSASDLTKHIEQEHLAYIETQSKSLMSTMSQFSK